MNTWRACLHPILTHVHTHLLQSLALSGGSYFIRVKTGLSDEHKGVEHVSTFISAVSHVIEV